SRLARSTAVAELLTRLPSDGVRLRDALAGALGDRTLALAYAVGDEPRWVDEAGHPVALPAGDDPERRATLVERDGRPVGAIVHDAALCDEPETLRAVAAGAALALENDRLAAELRSRVADLERSRARVVEVAIAERRRLERDLHDGAQQRLVAVAMGLGRARGKLDSDPDGAAELIAEAHADAKLAISELRDLARGIYPSVLGDRGLDAALSSLAARCPIPVDVSVDVEPRPSTAVESTAYFTVAEALTNIAKHSGATRAQVRVARTGNSVVVEVTDDGRGGAEVRPGGGLAGLADRAATIDGVVVVVSPAGGPTVIRTELPCAWS
ncbi:MAG TPA: sensor histidine kinase, partial [Nocardioides sp.]|nr:sensor histidine kinase [Nocardioides sp.]